MTRRILIGLVAVLAVTGPAPAQPPDLVCFKSTDERPAGAHAAVLALMDGMEPVLEIFPTYRDLLTTQATDVCLSASLHDARGYFSPEDNVIILQSDLTRDMQVAILIHELRHLEQYATGNCPTYHLAMSENARATLALEADASATSLFIANALGDAGQPQIWAALAAWPTHADIAVAFASELDASGDPREATTAAFAQWYASPWRRENYYRASCSSYLDRQDSTKSLPQYNKIAPGVFQRLCRLPDGSPYNCAEGRDGYRP
ncbi:MAG: hypothetical protein RQ750_07455 [Roseovarius sp.]|nr:hypothetical protein [Roseovarius sp.]